MTYQESLAWLYSTQQFGVKLGLENTRCLLEAVGEPQVGLRIFHVAGTNGKGSVCAMLDAMLRQAGSVTGLYTSPHLIDFRERIRVGGEMVAREVVTDGLTRLRRACADWEHCPTFFEISTVLALEVFSRAGCDFVVLETGMGGRLDATNAVEPIVSVLTPIAMDHSEWLGDTLAKIAGEKAGIIKPGIPAVSAPQVPEAAAVFVEKARSIGSPLSFVETPWSGALGLEGAHQRWNAALAIEALKAAGLEIPSSVITAGLDSVSWPARFQRLAPDRLLDGAHNPHAARQLVETWRGAFGDRKAVVVFGALVDKDFSEMIRILEAIAGQFFFVPVASARTADAGSFASLTSKPSRTFPDLAAALAAARDVPGPVLFTGSLFLAGEILDAFAGSKAG